MALSPVINPCITSTRDVRLNAGLPLTLRYRVIAQDGAFDAQRMSELARDCAEPKRPSQAKP